MPINTGAFAVAHESLLSLEAMPQFEPVLVDMQDRAPVYIRSQMLERNIDLVVFILSNTYSQRRADYEELLSALDSLSGVVTLRWTGNDGNTREYYASALSASADAWFNRATIRLVAPNPFAAQVA